jgi:MFS family permease
VRRAVADGLTLIASRALLAVGAAMIVPATLAGIRSTFAEASQRNMALGLWAAVGSGGAAFGPLVGGMLGAFLLGIGVPDQRADRAGGYRD